MILFWRLLGMIGAPILAAALAWVWVSDFFTIRNLRSDLKSEKEWSTRLHNAIEGPTGWRARLTVAENNTKQLRGAIVVQNKMIDDLVRTAKERQAAADAKLAEVRADRDKLEARYTVILNMSPQNDIYRQVLGIVFSDIPQ